jgi:hypothetical protein
VNQVFAVVAIGRPFRSMRNLRPALWELSCQLRLTVVASTECTISPVGLVRRQLARYAALCAPVCWLLVVSATGLPATAGSRKPVAVAIPATVAAVPARTARRRFLAFLASLRAVRVCGGLSNSVRVFLESMRGVSPLDCGYPRQESTLKPDTPHESNGHQA